MIRILICRARVNDIASEDDQIGPLLVEHGLNQTLRLQVVLCAVIEVQIAQGDDFEATVLVEAQGACILVVNSSAIGKVGEAECGQSEHIIIVIYCFSF